MADAREYSGNAVQTTLSGAITASAESMTIGAINGWPTGSGGTFRAVIDPGLASEEKVRCSGRSGSTISINARGIDGTSAQAHAVGAIVKHVFTAEDAKQFNAHASNTAIDDHTQYVHTGTPRTITADHEFTGDPTFSGEPLFTGTAHFSEAPELVFGNAGDVSTVGINTGNPGWSNLPARANHNHGLDLEELRSLIVPPGSYLAFAGENNPTNYLTADGSAVGRAQYPRLFLAIGTKFGAGNGTTTFNLPDCRDRFLVGAGATRPNGAKGGSDTHTLGVDNLPAHSHPITDVQHGHSASSTPHTHNIDGDGGNRIVVTAPGAQNQGLTGPVNDGVTFSDNDDTTVSVSVANAFSGITGTGNTGSGAAVNHVPPFIGVRILIKAA